MRLRFQVIQSLGNDGDNLPGSSDFNATLGIQYDFSLANNSSFARIDYAYISEYFNSVGSGTGQTPAGGFGQLNLKVGTQFDQISADIFVDNLTNNDGLTWVETVFSWRTELPAPIKFVPVLSV